MKNDPARVSTTSEPTRDGEQEIRDALAPFGWERGPEFWQRYYSDAWVFNLTNAVVRLSIDAAPKCAHAAVTEITDFTDDHHRWLCTCCGDVIEGKPIAIPAVLSRPPKEP